MKLAVSIRSMSQSRSLFDIGLKLPWRRDVIAQKTNANVEFLHVESAHVTYTGVIGRAVCGGKGQADVPRGRNNR